MSILSYIKNFGVLINFSHTIFLLPFAFSAVLLGYDVKSISIDILFWVTVALISARSAAMVMNRIVDLKYDILNPRTNRRPLVTGQVSYRQAWFWLVLASISFIIAAWALTPLCLLLSPIALILILGYSFTKRFTTLCHIWLGLSTALAPLGAWIAITGKFHWGAVVLSLATASWVAGFDIIYACQDVNFDHFHGLNSLPVRIGVKNALLVSRLFYALAIIGFFLLIPFFSLGRVYFIGISFIFIILVVGQWLVYIKLANVSRSFFIINSFTSIIFFVFLVADHLLKI